MFALQNKNKPFPSPPYSCKIIYYRSFCNAFLSGHPCLALDPCSNLFFIQWLKEPFLKSKSDDIICLLKSIWCLLIPLTITFKIISLSYTALNNLGSTFPASITSSCSAISYSILGFPFFLKLEQLILTSGALCILSLLYRKL